MVLFAQDGQESKEKFKYTVGPNVGEEADVPVQFRFEFGLAMNSYALPWIVQDRNKDGLPDTATQVHTDNYKKRLEVMDLNYDGTADDFAFFNNEGRLIFQIIDNDKDGTPDLWVNIKNGTYVQRFQRDKDGDGLVDVDRIYDVALLKD